MNTPAFVLGIDAGGTSLRAALAPLDADNPPSPLSPLAIPAAPDGGPAPLQFLLPDLLTRAQVHAENVTNVCAGITKITRADTRVQWEQMLTSLLPAAHVHVVPDYEIAFHGAISQGNGLAVIAGTGSVAYGENSLGQSLRIGGRGWEFGDEGSGAWLTAEMVRRTLRALDGLETVSPLTQAVCRKLETQEPAELGERARQAIAEQGRGFLVPLLLERARKGETDARNLYIGAAGWLAALARASLQRLSVSPEDIPIVATVGGLWQAEDLLTEPFTRVLRRWYPHAQVQTPEATPLEGAVRLAAKWAPTDGGAGRIVD